MHLIFIGYPGSGKGTVAKKLPNFKQISTGDMLREEIASGSELGLEIARIIDNGNLVDDQTALKLIQKRFDPNNQYIFDGFPRTLVQAEMLQNLVLKDLEFKAIYFKVDKIVLEERIVNRRSCGKCEAIYNLKFKSPKVDNTCDLCLSSPLIHRKDDTAEVLAKRCKVFEDHGPAILDFYRALGKLTEVDAQGDINSILSAILK